MSVTVYDYSKLPHDPAALCRERIDHWKHLLEQATMRTPIDKAEREKVVAKCVERIGVWSRRLKRLTAAQP